jgi:hypothetical protein
VLRGVNKRITAKPIIWIIDRQQWPRASLRAELIERGFDVIGFVELTTAVAALYDPDYVTPLLVILELQGQWVKKDELDTFTRTRIPVVVLGGAVELNQPLIKEFKWEAVIRRPFTLGNIADVVEGQLGKPEKEHEK